MGVFSNRGPRWGLESPSADRPAPAVALATYVYQRSPGYLEAAGTRLLGGREVFLAQGCEPRPVRSLKRPRKRRRPSYSCRGSSGRGLPRTPPVTAHSTWPGLWPPAPAPGSCAGTSLTLLPHRAFHCPWPDCSTHFDSPSENGM